MCKVEGDGAKRLAPEGQAAPGSKRARTTGPAAALHVFTRDLRVEDNLSLHALVSSGGYSLIRPIFVFTPEQTRDSAYFGARSFAFLVAALRDLERQIRGLQGQSLGEAAGVLLSGLEVYFGTHVDVLESLARASQDTTTPIAGISIAHDFTPYARLREDAVRELCEKKLKEVTFTCTMDEHSLCPGLLDVRSGVGTLYKVYTPFWKNAQVRQVRKPVSLAGKGKCGECSSAKNCEGSNSWSENKYAYSLEQAVSEFLKSDLHKSYFDEYTTGACADPKADPPASTDPVMEATRDWAMKRLLSYPFGHYLKHREGTENNCSLLGPHLKFGLVSVREVVDVLQTQRKSDADPKVITEYIRSLYWRDFYQYIIFHNPHVLAGMRSHAAGGGFAQSSGGGIEALSPAAAASATPAELAFSHQNENFAREFRGANIKWCTGAAAENAFTAWKLGNTGVPLVDAGMRELLHSGMMHNRSRMVVAMFLTKNLLIDWRVGERYFAQMLTDYDPLSNNGGWQWSSSTGADGSPYFRIMNPQSQLNKVDKTLKYTRKWLSKAEIGAIQDKDLLKWEEEKSRAKYKSGSLVAAAKGSTCSYLKPMVDLKKTREVAIAAFKTAAIK